MKKTTSIDSNESAAKSIKKSTKSDYLLKVQTVSVDGIVEAIEGIIDQLHSHQTPNMRFIPDSSGEMDTLKAIMGKDAPDFERSVRKLKTRLMHLEKWDELDPKYVFRAIDKANNKIDEYEVTFKKDPSLVMVVDIYEKGLASSSSVTHGSHVIDLHKNPSAFKKYLGNAFALLGVTVLVELLII